MIMKNNKQIGFIYKNNESIDKIIKNGDVVFEKGFLRERTSTTLPITFGGVGKDLKDYRVYGNTKQQILPDGYTQVDYIESSGTQYIDTSFTPDSNTKYDIKVTPTTNITTTSYFISAFGDSKRNNIYSTNGKKASAGYGSVYKNTSTLLDTNTTYNFILDKNKFYINGELTETLNEETFENTANSTLFAQNTNGSISNYSEIKLHYCKIYDNDVLVRNFIPCYRNSDNEIGLYDLVNNVFYTNQGTGTFSYGTLAPTPDSPIEIVSCGDKTNNLFDFDKIFLAYYDSVSQTKKNAMNINYTNDTITFTSFNNDSFFPTVYNGVDKIDNVNIPVKPNTNYSILYNYNVSGIENVLVYALNEATQKYVGLTITDITGGKTFNTGNYSQICIRFGTRNDNGNVCVISNICLKESTIGDTYEPYGYKIPINVQSSNLYNVRDRNSAPPAGATLEEDYIIFDYDNTASNRKEIIYTTNNLNLKPSTTYLCVAEIEEVSGTGTFRPITRWDSQNTGQFNYDEAGFPFSDLSAGQKIMFTATTYSNLSVKIGGLRTIALYQPGEKGRIKVRLSILEDITITQNDFKYQPYYNEITNIYLDEPLRKIGEYNDYIDFINGKVVRNINEIVLDGSGYWGKVSGTTNSFYHPMEIGTYDNNKKWLISDYYISVERTNIDNTKNYITMNSDGNIRINNINITTVNDFKTWLSENNTTVDYILPTSTEESITLPNIPTIDGNNTLNIETEITPSQVYIKYKSNT